jgi:hypothetical protein
MERFSSAQLTRLVRCGAIWPGQSGDGAVLTRTLPLLKTGLPDIPGSLESPGLVKQNPETLNMVHGLIHEAAKPDIHYQADRHEHKQGGRAAVAHKR